jgi:hypothetical protein
MALSAKNRAEIIALIGSEVDFERSGISGRIVRDATACPRQGELTDREYGALMAHISANMVRYVVFSYITPIAWVGRDDLIILVDRKFSATTSQHQKMVVEAFDKVSHLMSEPQAEAPVQEAPKASQYAELTEDELIELADDLAHLTKADKTLVAVVEALKARRDATVPARRRISEYLRQQAITQAEYEKKIKSTFEYERKSARKPEDVISAVHTDEWVNTAALRLSDLQRLVTPLIRDTQAEFFEEQQARLDAWKKTAEYAKLPEKQKALMKCAAEGHIEHGYRGWRGQESCCQDVHGSTMSSFTKKNHIVVSRPKVGLRHDRHMLMLKKPEAQQ